MALLSGPLFGEPTSTLDWCEDNYEVTWYIAEFWNTVTNLSMILPSMYGIYQARKQHLEARFLILNFLFLLVGIGSWMFHMSLRYTMQLLDELPMVWGTGYMIYCMHMALTSPQLGSIKAAVSITVYCTLFTIVYLTFKNPIIHQTMYGLLVCVIFYQCVKLLQTQYSKEAAMLYLAGLAMYLVGFFLWNIDTHFCWRVQEFRAAVPEILRPLTQLHGWWHLLAGYATYMNILYWQHHRMTYLKRPVTLSPSWLGLTVKNRRLG